MINQLRTDMASVCFGQSVNLILL